MNTADLCVDGLRLYAEYETQENAYQKFERIHMLMLMICAIQKFNEHVDGCEQCGGQSD